MPPAQTSKAVIFRTWDFGEADLLVSFFTQEMGRLKGVAKAARKSKKRFVNCLDHFSLVNLEYESRRASELYLIHSGRLVEGYGGIRGDFQDFSLAGYLVELTEALFPPQVPAPEVFTLLVDILRAIDRGDNSALLRIAFEARVMALGGYAIGLDRCSGCGREYQRKGRAVFDSEKGGIYCLKCRVESPGVPSLGAEAGSLLSTLQKLGAEALSKNEVDPEACAEIRYVMDLHIARRLGRALKTAAFLD
ncbi:MAG TPA: DNA repair protein RecO [Desulfobacteraceae bacterium]|nr:DNA repair protein RecO [Desulfobacteraceae bacterium]